MEQKYEVTIGIPVYNVEKYIRQTIDSALAQTFKSIEFLICDDCGTDSSISIVEEYQQTHPRGKDIRIIHQPRNMGVGEARNRIIDETHSEYLFFMDSDDILTEDAIEKLYGMVLQNNADIVYGSMEKMLVYDNNKRIRNAQYPLMTFLKENEFADYVYRQYDGIQASSCNFLIRVDIYRKNNIRYQPVNYWEDMTMTIDLPCYITRAVLLPDVTYLYVCRENTLSNYQQRSIIGKSEIEKTIQAMKEVKNSSYRLKERPYFHKRMYKVMMTLFYIVCSILKNEKIISPAFTKREIRDVMKSPLSFAETCMLGWRVKNLFLYSLGVLPPFMAIALIRMIARKRGLL
jgi:glycosyltransferase involved in cell wall biosynthesis